MGREQQEARSIFLSRSSEETLIKGEVVFVKSRENLKENHKGHGYLFIFVWVSGAVWPAAISAALPSLHLSTPHPINSPRQRAFLKGQKFLTILSFFQVPDPSKIL